MKSVNSEPKISIGLPVYNGERVIRKALDSLLRQTFVDFELIISDNASTDSTQTICEEYAKKDSRIRYFHHTKNMGAIWNYRFVLQEAKYNYFHWAAVDDLWHPDFLQKNIQILESNQNVVGSIGKVMFYEKITDNLDDLIKYSKNNSMKYQHALSAYGTYEKKIRIYLKLRQSSAVYGLYRTEKLRKCISHNEYISWDFALVLNILKYGDFHVIDEILMYRYAGGVSGTKSNLEYMLEHKFPISVILFPNIPFAFWCAKKFGIRIFLKNLPWIIRFACQGELQFVLDLIQLYKSKIRNKSDSNNE